MSGAAIVVVLGTVALAAVLLASSRASLVAGSSALARVELPLGGGTVVGVRATGPGGRPIPIAVRGGRLWPQVPVAPGALVAVEAIVRRPGWIAWLAGSQDRERLLLRTASAAPRDRYLTLASGTPLRLAFDRPVRVLAYGQPGALRRHVLARAESKITLDRPSQAGALEVAAAPRTWESLPPPVLVSWFPAATSATAVASPAPEARISPMTPISLTFSQPVARALGSARPRLSPSVPGSWQQVGGHTVVFKPTGTGFGFGSSITVQLPHAVRLVDGSSSAAWTVPPASTLRAQQLLAQLGYLPLRFTPAATSVARTVSAQEAAAVNPPAGSLSWRYGNVPASLRAQWKPGQDTVLMHGAVMAFENDHGLTADGIAGPQVWRALIAATIAGRRTTASYSYVSVDEATQRLVLWHNGRDTLTTPVNTGGPGTPTAKGTFPVFEHIAAGTMSGTNPGGSHYNDPGVPWISYFNGGDALHGFYRAQYGYPQSLGCVEMPVPTAGHVWPYTSIGTLVHVA